MSANGYLPRSIPLHSRIPDKPLIDRVTNEWRSDPKYRDFYDKYEEDDYGQFAIPAHKFTSSRRLCPLGLPRRPQRLLACYVLFLIFMFYIWHSWVKPTIDATDRYDLSIYRSQVYGTKFGQNARPDFSDMIQLQHLESKNVPGATSKSPKRLIFIGDVHGCKVELLALLDKIKYNKHEDHIIFTGDMLFKGPDSLGVIDFARSVGASSVRGNHEDRVLLAWASMNGAIAPAENQMPPPAPVTKTPGAKSAPSAPNSGPSFEELVHGDVRHRALAGQMSKDQIEWLQKCPVILHVGKIAKSHDYVVVHAGLAPGVPLEKQDPFQVMNMRTIDLATRVPTEQREGEPWEKVWNHFQKAAVQERQRVNVVYGHDSKRGLNIEKYTRGLDSGCVKGGKLTALVVNEHGKEKIYNVRCKNDYTTNAWKSEFEKLEEEGSAPLMGSS